MRSTDIRARRRGDFSIRGIAGTLVVFALIGARIWSRSERRERRNQPSSPASVPFDPDAFAANAADEAAAHLDAGRCLEAIGSANAAISKSPGYVAAYVIRSAAYRKLGNLDAAIADATQASTLKPADTNLMLFRGALLMESKRYPEAEAAFGQAIAANGKLHGAFLARATSRFEQGKFDLATADLGQVFSNAPATWDGLVEAKGLQKKIADAKAAKAEKPPEAGGGTTPPGK